MPTTDAEERWAGTAARSGALAGTASTFAFTWIHDFFISDIWSTLVVMMAAGALCGLCVGWSYALLAPSRSIGGWLRYNLLYVAMLVLLGVASVLVFEPVTTMAAVIAADGPPEALIGQALPLTATFTLGAAALIHWQYGRSRAHFGAISLTCVVLVLLLGLNVSALGLVSIPRSGLYLVLEMFGLILALNVVYVIVFAALERKRLGVGAHIESCQAP